MRTLALTACGCSFAVSCPDEETTELVERVFGGLRERPGESPSIASTAYRVERTGTTGFRVEADDGSSTASFEDADALLFYLDKSLTLALQRQRPDLYFVHAAAVAKRDWVGVLAAPRHTGKSTLVLALLEKGFRYLSDELAPIDVRGLRVYPYSHAVCLKSHPPAPMQLPTGTVRVGGRFHVPCGVLPGGVVRHPEPLSAFIFLRRSSSCFGQTSHRIAAASAVAHLMANSLNALAHPNNGLDAAMSLAQRAPCFEVDTYDLAAACAQIDEMSRNASLQHDLSAQVIVSPDANP